ncbi:diphosphoinositol polyphosphate phosphohydrolase 2-like [Daphnia pulicaria]|uniref:diphosphoinositol polyphosphate phosphohydrolase 2-like n=1 Tax=Daphnia pulicaria TaxID=35523 RepID=UPI001EEC21A8|nr:diphosphoinositol polyphosphate phosphohydrolase 2-like [Daphnia pulicaria]
MVKDKPNSTRVYDDDGYRKRAACVCVKENDHNQILLVSSSNENSSWIVPGGGLEPNEEPPEAAVREVMEEAGVSGRLGICLGVFENNERKHRTTVYILHVTNELSEWDDSKTIGRRRRWFQYEEALAHLTAHKPLMAQWLLNKAKAEAPR